MADDSSSTPTSTAYHPPSDTLHDTPARVVLDVPTRVVVKILFIIGAFGAGLWVMRELSTLLIQLAIAIFLAVAADPLVRRLDERGLGRGKAVAVVMLAAFGVAALVVAVFAPPLVEQADRLIDAAPGIVRDVQDSRYLADLDQRYDIVDKASKEAAKLPGTVSSELGSVVGAVLAGAFGALTIFFLTVFLLLGGGQVVHGTARIFPALVERRWWTIVQGAYLGISAYVGGAIVIALIGGTSVALMAVVLGLPYALPLGLWMMLLEIIPMVGATIGAVPAIIVAFVAGGITDGIVMSIFILVYQQFENIVIQPRVQGKVASLSPLAVFFSVLVGSQLLGVLGALFAVPVAGVVLIFLRQVVDQQGSGHIELPDIMLPIEPPPPPDIEAEPVT